jgi:hypothetical protein
MKSVHKIKGGKKRGSLKVRTGLLLVQALLPFGLYWALISDNSTAAIILVVLFTSSMALTVWLG